ncbi:hypothetical protein H5398_08555 [Tessaracoccus sp. MC1679]|uniref:hypothetical protein n=1 Tax=Tessaracoccus sp. MC1679 TaxID=2760313 RepID=UPI001602631D|nr:hypothetical protein [Tessaracoccus sp. MC1679]MBB1516016.1 hypothetical protein [Tessaracoccus sp. MC1679]
MVNQVRNEQPIGERHPLVPTNFLMRVARQAMGTEFQVIAEQGAEDWAFPGQRLASSGAEFVDAVERQLAQGAVLAVPTWVQDRGPLSPMPGQELVERVRLSEHPFGILVPLLSIVGERRSDRLREALLRHTRSLFILEANKVLEGVDPRFTVVLIVVHTERVGDRPLNRFVRVPHDPDADVVLEEIERLRRMRGGSKASGFVHLGEIDPYSPLTYRHYDPVLRAREAELQTWGDGVALGERFELLIPESRIRPRNAHQGIGHGRFVTGRSISRSGRLEIAPSSEPPRTPPLSLMAGDLVMQALFMPTNPGGLRVAEIREEDLPVSALQHVLVLRPKQQMSEPESFLLLHYLRSGLAKELVAAGGAKSTLTPSVLDRLYTPVADEALLNAVGSIVEVERMLRQWGEDAAKRLDSIFLLESPKAAREALIERGRDSRLRVDAARRVDDFDHRVRTLYPYPVAYRWRSLESIASKGEPAETLREIRHGFEHILAFCGCLALAVAREEGIDLPESRLFGVADDYMTFLTTWTTILEQVRKKVRGGITNSQLLIRLGTFQGDADVAAAVARLAAYRRQEAHTVATADEEALAEQLLSDVRTLVQGLNFLSDYELVEIVDSHWDRIARRNTVKYRAFVGDHAIVPIRTITVGHADVEKDSLYIREKDSKEFLALLRPYLIGRRCGDCKNWGTFYLHAIQGERAMMKSVELGHPNEVEDLASALRAVAAAPAGPAGASSDQVTRS